MYFSLIVALFTLQLQDAFLTPKMQLKKTINKGISMFLKIMSKLTFHTEEKSFVCRCQAPHPIPGPGGCKFQCYIVQISYWHFPFSGSFFYVEWFVSKLKRKPVVFTIEIYENDLKYNFKFSDKIFSCYESQDISGRFVTQCIIPWKFFMTPYDDCFIQCPNSWVLGNIGCDQIIHACFYKTLP